MSGAHHGDANRALDSCWPRRYAATLRAALINPIVERVQATVPVPFIHLVDATAKETLRGDIHSVALLGARRTMERDF